MTRFRLWKTRLQHRRERRRLERNMTCCVCDHYCRFKGSYGLCEVLPGSIEDRMKRSWETCDCGGFVPMLIKGE